MEQILLRCRECCPQRLISMRFQFPPQRQDGQISRGYRFLPQLCMNMMDGNMGYHYQSHEILCRCQLHCHSSKDKFQYKLWQIIAESVGGSRAQSSLEIESDSDEICWNVEGCCATAWVVRCKAVSVQKKCWHWISRKKDLISTISPTPHVPAIWWQQQCHGCINCDTRFGRVSD